jgi:DNA-binding GntR family transcriptional regulator
MTPQTAAALRALVEYCNANSGPKDASYWARGYARAHMLIAEKLAAVLTQEGAEDTPWKQAVLTQCMIYEGGWCEADPEKTMRQLLDIVAGLQAAPAEAAERKLLESKQK